MELRLKRCVVRPWRMADAASLASHANNRRVSMTLRDRFPYPYTIDHANEFLSRVTADHPITNFCVDIEDHAVGGIAIRLGEDVNRHTAELGYWLAEPFWRRGIMTEVVWVFVNYCFENFPLHRIYAQAHANNPASARVLEKAGFNFEGRLRKNVVKDNQILDSLLYARTK